MMDNSTIEGRAAVRWVVALDSGDEPWGWAMAHAFGMCEVLAYSGHDVPAELEYRPGVSLDHVTEEWPDAEYLTLLDNREADAADLQYWARVMGRYCDLLRAAGLDY